MKLQSRVKKMKNLVSAEKIFRQIDSLVETLFSRNFCQKYVRENFRNFHTVRSVKVNFSRVSSNFKECLLGIWNCVLFISFILTISGWIFKTRTNTYVSLVSLWLTCKYVNLASFIFMGKYLVMHSVEIS